MPNTSLVSGRGVEINVATPSTFIVLGGGALRCCNNFSVFGRGVDTLHHQRPLWCLGWALIMLQHQALFGAWAGRLRSCSTNVFLVFGLGAEMLQHQARWARL